MPSLRPPGVLGDAASVTVTPSFPAEASPSTADPARPLRQGEDDLVARINAERASRSLPALTVDPGLLQLAAQWAATMPVDGYRHSPDERLRAIMSSEDLGVIGENIHAPEPQCSAGVPCTDIDLQPTSGVVAVDWMNSQTHRDNLLDPRWDRLGVSLFCDSSGRMWAAALFAGPVGSAPENPTAGEPAGRLADASNGGYTCTGDRRGNSATWKHPPAS